MGYSNNKWCKILTILCIINLCFILFAKFTKVFGSSTFTLNNFPELPNDYVNQNFIILKYPNVETYYYLFILNDLVNDNNHVQSITTSPYTQLTFPSGSGKWYRTPTNGGNSWEYRGNIETTNHFDRYGFYYSEILLSSVDIYDDNGSTIVFEKNYSPFNAPHFLNTTEIENATNPDVIISRGDYSYNDYLYFHLLQINYTITENDSTIYYYSDKTFALNKDSKYYYTYENDTDNKYSYYSIPRSALGLDPNTSYLYVLTNSQKQFNNSSGILEKDDNSGIYDVVQMFYHCNNK